MVNTVFEKKNKILIIAATHAELNPLLQFFCFTEKKTNYPTLVYKNVQIDFLISGIGMLSTAYHLTVSLLRNKYDLVINAGIAGSFSKKHKIGEVLQVQTEELGDLGIEENEDFLSLFDANLLENDAFPYRSKKLINETTITNKAIFALPQVSGLSVNTAHGCERSIARLRQKFDADIENMEGAAVFFVCLFQKQAFVEIRAISNLVEKRDKSKWNIPLAVKELNNSILDILNEF